MTTNAEAARQYLTERRDRLSEEIAILHGRMMEIDNLLSELDGPLPPRVTPSTRKVVPAPGEIAKKRKVAIREALMAAGTQGLTAAEASEITGVLVGTCSSNLAQLKASGRATHVKPRYFAVMSATH